METDNKKTEYGAEYTSHRFEQYRLYLSSIEKISDRREGANKYFISLNSALMVAGTFLIGRVSNKADLTYLLFGVLFLGVILSVVFFFLINSYKQINSGKFELLNKIEEDLPLRLYSEEWSILGRGKDYEKYFPFSHIERMIPFVFVGAYLGGIIFLLVKIF